MKKPTSVIQYKFRPVFVILYRPKKHKTEQEGCALAQQLCIIQFLSSVQVAEPRIKTEVRITST
jgi:hypothetical protein